jgi:hypothetical protein
MPNLQRPAKASKKKSSKPKSADLVEHGSERAVIEHGKKWENGQTLKVFFMKPYNKTVASKCLAIMKQWEEYANLKFEETKKIEDSDLRVAYEKGGSFSYIGTDAKLIEKDKLTMNFGWLTETSPDDEYERVVLHETGHAIGLTHEHEHPEATIPWDEDAVIAYYKRQGWTAEQTREQVLTKTSKEKTQYTKYDKTSIMEYPIPEELVTDKSYAVGWNKKLSKMDKEFIAQQYPGAKKGSSGGKGKGGKGSGKGSGSGSGRRKGSSSSSSRRSRRGYSSSGSEGYYSSGSGSGSGSGGSS